MGLGTRTARQHESALSMLGGVDTSRWDFQPNQAVMTVDGFRGVVSAVHDGPIAGTESYIVMLANGLGGGEYSSSQLSAIGDVTGKVHTTAAEDYPELGSILEDRPDIARNTVMASKTATQSLCPDHGYLHGGEPSLIVDKKDCDVCKRQAAKHSKLVADCENCGEQHEASYDHEGDFNQGPIYASVCPKDNLTDYWNRHGVREVPDDKPLGLTFSRNAAAGDHVQRFMDWSKTNGQNPDDLGTLLKYEKQPGVGRSTTNRIADEYHLAGDDWRQQAKTGAKRPVRTDPQTGLEKCHAKVDGVSDACKHTLGHTQGHELDYEAAQAQGDGKTAGVVVTDWTRDEQQHLLDGMASYDTAFHRGAEMLREASKDNDFRFHVTATWSDVRRKAKRIRAEGGVHITLSTEGMVIAEVKGDTNVYESGLQRLPGKAAIQTWSCGCKWGAYHWGAEDDFSRFAGRMCSHALALHYEAQSRGMFGRSVDADDTKPHWAPRKVVVKYDIDDRRNVRAPATTRPGDYARMASLDHVAEMSPVALLLVTSAREHTLAATAVAMDTLGFHEAYVSPATLSMLAAVNNAWGEPTPPENDPLPGPTMKPVKDTNPADTGWASAPDPTSWDQAMPDNQVDRMTASRRADMCGNCGEEIHDAGGIDPNVPWVHAGTGNSFCDVGGTNDAALLAGSPLHRPEAEPIMHESAKQATNDEARDWNMPDSLRDDETISGRSQGQQAAANDIAAARATEFRPATADLNASPEGALPTTDGVDDAAMDPYGSAGDIGDPTSLEPEDPSFVSTGSLEDIVAQFQATAGAAQLQGGGSPDGNSEIARMAMETLANLQPKTALRDFTPGEQAQIINEGSNDVRAGNFASLDIKGTHYEHLEAAFRAVEDEDDDGGWLS